MLAQIYEAKGDPLNEAAQLREYLRYTERPADIAAVQQVLAKLAKQPSGDALPATTKLFAGRRWGPADIDEAIPPVRAESPCPLPQILE